MPSGLRRPLGNFVNLWHSCKNGWLSKSCVCVHNAPLAKIHTFQDTSSIWNTKFSIYDYWQL